MSSPAASTLTSIKTTEHLRAEITNDPQLILKAQQLRYRVFAEGMGAKLKSDDLCIDNDEFDHFCEHLVVVDNDNESVVGYSRILNNHTAAQAGSYYTESEFDLSKLLNPQHQMMEVGRTCVDSNYRSGAVIGLIWSRIGQYINERNIDFLMGCASIPFSVNDGGAKALAAVRFLLENFSVPESQYVTPFNPLPQLHVNLEGKQYLPPLLKAYLRIGAKVGGHAHWDKDFNVADVVMLLDVKEINQRYLRHFLKVGA